MDIRQLSSADAAPYRVLMLDAYSRFSDAFTSTAEERSVLPLSWWEERVADADGTSVVIGALVEKTLVGAVGIEFETRAKTRHKSSLFGMFVAPEHRGRGIGHALVEAAIVHAQARPGAILILLSLTGGNDSAQKLYEACGFATFGIQPMGLYSEGRYHAKVLMWRRLDRG